LQRYWQAHELSTPGENPIKQLLFKSITHAVFKFPSPSHLPASHRPPLSLYISPSLQVYAPIDNNPAAFHRTISLFISPQGDQLTKPGAIRALRCQLPRQNPFYPIDPAPKTQLRPTPLPAAAAAAAVLGNIDEEEKGKPDLCSVENQDPWKAGYYEQQKTVNVKKKNSHNNNNNNSNSSNVVVGEEEQLGQIQDSVFLYPEKELVVEPEDLHRHDNDSEVTTTNGAGAGGGKKKTEYDEKLKALIAQYKACSAQEGDGDTINKEEDEEDDLPESVLNELEDAISKEQRHFASFAARIAHEPAQCLRYCFTNTSGSSGSSGHAHPIWPSCHNIPGPTDIPRCERCGGKRRFEFQVMPQLINHLGVDPEDRLSPDWGMIAVYSCSESCNTGDTSDSAYVEEFVWVQAGN